MFVPKSWFKRLTFLYQSSRLIKRLTLLLLVFAAFSFALPQLSLGSELPDDKAADSSNNADSASPADSDAAKDPEDASRDSDESSDTADILYAIRKIYAEKFGMDKQTDDMILSQSSSYVFLSRKKVQDVENGILDNWLLSSFEDYLNLTLIKFYEINIPPIKINLDSDIAQRMPIYSADDLMQYYSSDAPISVSCYTNFRIPETVLKYANENSDETDKSNDASSSPETMASLDYFVLFLGILGFSIFGYIVYRIVVWAFMIDQPSEPNSANDMGNNIVVPIDNDAFSSYYYQAGVEDREK